MSDFRLRRLDDFRIKGDGGQETFAIPVPRTPSGKVYQYSPNPEAAPRLFLLGGAPDERSVPPEHLFRIRRNPGPGETVCPYSGMIAPDSDFLHSADLDSAKELVAWAAEEEVARAFEGITRNFNRSWRSGGMFSVSMEFKHRSKSRPTAIREDLLREMRCEVCAREYGVYAISLFCPDCGAPNVSSHFKRETELVLRQIAIAEEQNARDEFELAYRLTGNAHEDVLTAFEATLKSVYRYAVKRDLHEKAEALTSKKSIGNAFQNIERAKNLYGQLNIDPFSALTEDDVAFLALNIQKRHVIGHNLGVADEHYAELMQDDQPGETVRLIGDEITRFANICARVIAHLEETLLPASEPKQP